jgi:hypothetical protein
MKVVALLCHLLHPKFGDNWFNQLANLKKGRRLKASTFNPFLKHIPRPAEVVNLANLSDTT